MGSKNKEKDSSFKKSKLTIRERAENAAYNCIEDEDTCKICEFKFDNSIKKDKKLTTCLSCHEKVHKPCLQKSGCICNFK